MATYAQMTKQLGDVWVDALKRAEDSVTTAARTRPTVSAARRTRVFGQELPTMREVVEANYELAERLLKAQKHYALRAIEVAFPEPAKPVAAATHARRPAARKTRRARSSRTPAAPA
jgi:hypothetical protein